jgi:hypothetical protein
VLGHIAYVVINHANVYRKKHNKSQEKQSAGSAPPKIEAKKKSPMDIPDLTCTSLIDLQMGAASIAMDPVSPVHLANALSKITDIALLHAIIDSQIEAAFEALKSIDAG